MTFSKQQVLIKNKFKSESNLTSYLISQLSEDTDLSASDLEGLEPTKPTNEIYRNKPLKKHQSTHNLSSNTLPHNFNYQKSEPLTISTKKANLKYLLGCLNSEEATSLEKSAEHCKRHRRKSTINNYYFLRVKDVKENSNKKRKYQSGNPQQVQKKTDNLTIEKQQPISLIHPPQALFKAVICQLDPLELALNIETVCTEMHTPIWPTIFRDLNYPLFYFEHFNPILNIFFLRSPLPKKPSLANAVCIKAPPIEQFNSVIYRANTRNHINRRRNVQSDGELEIKFCENIVYNITEEETVTKKASTSRPQELAKSVVMPKNVEDKLVTIEKRLVKSDYEFFNKHSTSHEFKKAREYTNDSAVDLPITFEDGLTLVRIVKKACWPNYLGMELEQLAPVKPSLNGKFRVKGFSPRGIVQCLAQLELKNLVSYFFFSFSLADTE